MGLLFRLINFSIASFVFLLAIKIHTVAMIDRRIPLTSSLFVVKKTIVLMKVKRHMDVKSLYDRFINIPPKKIQCCDVGKVQCGVIAGIAPNLISLLRKQTPAINESSDQKMINQGVLLN